MMVEAGSLQNQLCRCARDCIHAGEEVIELPAEAGICFDLLPDGDVLCSVRQASENVTAGIYRYDPDEGVSTLLVEGGISLSS